MTKSAIRRLQWLNRNISEDDLDEKLQEVIVTGKLNKRQTFADYMLRFTLYDPFKDFSDLNFDDKISIFVPSERSTNKFHMLPTDEQARIQRNYDKALFSENHSLLTVRGILCKQNEQLFILAQLLVTTKELVTATSKI